MPIVESLAKDHRTLEKLLTRLGEIPSSEPDKRTEVFSRLQTLLQGHSRAEEELVYRRLRQCQPEESKILEAYEEHHVADLLLQELASACPGRAGWAAKVKVLEELLRHHVKEEELNLFPLIEENFDEATLRTMSEEFEVLKHERIEKALGAVRRATPAFAGRAMITGQAAAGRLLRRGELVARRLLSRLRRPQHPVAAT